MSEEIKTQILSPRFFFLLYIDFVMNLKCVLPVLCIHFSCFASTYLEEMSLEEKVGQLLMVHFNGETVNEDAKILVQEVKVGGIIYYNWSNGLHGPKQIQSLSSGLQTLAYSNQNPIPLLIATDQEGGVVARLYSGFTRFPGNQALGETSNPNLAYDAAFAMGQELQSVGINMNLSPVVDVNSNPRNPVIGVRSFGSSAEKVALFGEKALEGYKQAQIIATLKHFPGYGDVAVDPHEDLPVIHKSREELQHCDLLPFIRLSSSADAIMTAHILVPSFDRDNCSTLSKKTLDYLKHTIGFQGVIVADSLVMEGVVKKCKSVDEAAIQALEAGCDILILGGKLLNGFCSELSVADVKRVHLAIVHAVQTGRVSEERLNEAVEKIIDLKNRYLSNSMHVDQIDSLADHDFLAKKIGRLALKVTKSPSDILFSLHEKKISVFAPKIMQATIEETNLLNIGKSTDSFFFSSLCPSKDEIEIAKEQTQDAEILLIFSYNAWKNRSQEILIQSLLEIGKKTILVVARDPLDEALFHRADLIFTTFSPSLPSLQAVCDELSKK